MISKLKSEGLFGKQDFIYVGAEDIYLGRGEAAV